MSSSQVDFAGGQGGPQTEHYGIGTISEDASNFSIIQEFDATTYERFAGALHNALAANDRFTAALVSKNFQTYLSTQRFASRLIGLGFRGTNRPALGEALMGQVVNWLTSFRLFLAHSERSLKRRFGDDSAQVGRFKKDSRGVRQRRWLPIHGKIS